MTLVIKNDGIGDLVLASGLISDLARERGPLDLVTCETNREIAENIEGIRRIFLVSRDSIRYRPWPMRLGFCWRTGSPEDRNILRELERARYSVALCLRRFIRKSSLILMAATRADRRHCAWLYPTNATTAMARGCSDGWNHFQGNETGSELTYYREFLAAALGVSSASPPRLRCCPPGCAKPEPGRVGLILSGASTNWPDGHWIELAARLGRLGVALVMFGGPEAVPLAREIESRVPGVENCVGRLGLVEAVPALARLSFIVGNDTGMTHFASLVVPKMLVILGGGTFGRFFPWPDNASQVVVFTGMDCFDCDWNCRHPRRECLWQLNPEGVAGVAERMLKGESLPQRINLNTSDVEYSPGWRRRVLPANEANRRCRIPGGAPLTDIRPER